MKNEPELIDIYAMFALMGLMQRPVKTKSKIDTAYEAFGMAKTMMEVRADYVKKGEKTP